MRGGLRRALGRPIADRLAHAGRGALSALHFAGVGVGIAVSAALVSALLAAGADWRVLWLASGAAPLAALAAVARLVPGGEPPRVATAPPPGGSAPGRGLAALARAYGLFGFGYVVTATFPVAIVRAGPGVRPVEPLVWVVVGGAAARRRGGAAAPSVAVKLSKSSIGRVRRLTRRWSCSTRLLSRINPPAGP